MPIKVFAILWYLAIAAAGLSAVLTPREPPQQAVTPSAGPPRPA